MFAVDAGQGGNSAEIEFSPLKAQEVYEHAGEQFGKDSTRAQAASPQVVYNLV
jgi:hypothetical protein